MNLAFKHILVPFDGSEQSIVAINTAIYFSKSFNSQITVIYIEEETPVSTIKGLLDTHCKGIDYQFLHKEAKPFKGIIDAVKEIDADLVIMGTHGVSGFEEFWMGGNSYKVVTSARCPVLTVREGSAINNFKNIVVPIDTSFESRQKVPFAVSLAKKFGSKLHVYGVSVDNDKESEHQIFGYLRQVLTVLKDEKIEYTHSEKFGVNVTDATIEYAKSINADLIIIMTEQEAQIGSFFLGKFAQQMVNHSPIPVLSLAPREDLIVTDARI